MASRIGITAHGLVCLGAPPAPLPTLCPQPAAAHQASLLLLSVEPSNHPSSSTAVRVAQYGIRDPTLDLPPLCARQQATNRNQPPEAPGLLASWSSFFLRVRPGRGPATDRGG